jgi:8-oxo-dGTP pyrophosphatase MutT (NUDIX family)
LISEKTVPKAAERFAFTVIENNSNELLLLKRHPRARIGPGLWGFSSGHIETGESPEQCSQREIKEELGTRFMLEKIGQVGPVRDTLYGGIYDIYLFHYKWQGGSITLNHEHTEYAWAEREKFRDYAVVDGIDEDIYHLRIWPVNYLNPDKLPARKPE